MGRNDLFPSSCFPAEERYIYPGSRGICVFPDVTRELYHTSLSKTGSRDFTARPRREWETVADSAWGFILIALSLNTVLKRKEE